MSSEVQIPKDPKLVTMTEIEDKRPTVVRQMSHDQLVELDKLITKGVTSWKIALKAQKHWKLQTDISTQAVSQQIDTYRRKYHISQVVTTTTTTDHETKEVKQEVKTSYMVTNFLRGRLDAYAVNEQMVTLQIGRINKIMEREAKMPTLLDQTRKELELLMKMMQNFTNLQFELGILHRTAQVLEHHHTLNNPDLLDEEERVANKIKAIQGKATILGKVKNVLSLVARMEEGQESIIEAEVVELERNPYE
jgi:hypothetical protein